MSRRFVVVLMLAALAILTTARAAQATFPERNGHIAFWAKTDAGRSSSRSRRPAGPRSDQPGESSTFRTRWPAPVAQTRANQRAPGTVNVGMTRLRLFQP